MVEAGHARESGKLRMPARSLTITETVKTAGRSVVGGKGEAQRNRGSEEMHLRALFGTGYTRDVYWTDIQVGRSSRQTLRNNQVARADILAWR